MKYKIIDTKDKKILRSDNLNYIFYKNNGIKICWGSNLSDDPNFSPIGPFVADIEITTKCSGINNKPCSFCYKSNTPKGKNMSFETFKIIFDKLPKVLNQIAFGVDSQAISNPDLFKMMEYVRNNNVIPNLTVADISEETAKNLAKYCGGVSVSRYEDKDVCYNSIERLVNAGIKQVNMHYMISNETLSGLYETLEDIKTDNRLRGLRSIVCLSLKQKGRGLNYTPISYEEYKNIVNLASKLNIMFGFDSCGAHKFLEATKDYPNFERIRDRVEPCESSCFSIYINVDGYAYPCSFAEGTEDWESGINVIKAEDFIKEVWYSERMEGFRNKLISCNRNCFLYKI